MAVDYFLKIEGISGEATDAVHKGAIPIESFSWGATQQGEFSGGGGGAGKVSMQDFHFTTRYSNASIHLFASCSTGEHLKKAQLFCRKAGGKQEEFLQIDLTNVLVSSYQTGGSSGSDIIPMDQVSLTFQKIEFVYKGQKADGSLAGPVKSGYDLALNKKI